MNEFTFNLLKIVVSVSVTLITIFLVPYIKNKIKDSKYANLVKYVEVAVRAAEQTIKGSGVGAAKKGEVIAYVTAWMTANGIEITKEQLSELIEAAVFNMNREA